MVSPSLSRLTPRARSTENPASDVSQVLSPRRLFVTSLLRLARRSGAFWSLVALSLVALLCAHFVDARALAPGTAIGTFALLCVVWPWLNLLGVRGQCRFLTTRAREDDEVEIDVTLWNRALWPSYAITLRGLTDTRHIPGHAGCQEAGIARVRAKAATQTRHKVKVQRGEYPGPNSALISAFPFGVWEARHSLSIEEKLLVWPRTFVVGALPPLRSAHRSEGAARSARTGTSGDIQGTRPYREGDSPRRIHWAQTARYDRLIVCETESTQAPRAEVCLDVDARSHRGSGSDSSLAWAVRVAASLCESWAREGASVELRCGQASTGSGSGSRHISHMLDALACVEEGHDHISSLEHIYAHPPAPTTSLRAVITTDRSLKRFEGTYAGQVPHLVFVLCADAFADSEDEPTSAVTTVDAPDFDCGSNTVCVPITEPQDVAWQVQRGLGEASRVF